METLICIKYVCIKMTFSLIKSNGREIGFRGMF
jgi:hypothetical protein